MEGERQPVLVVIEGPNVGESFPLEGTTCTLGRSSDNAIVLDSTRVSRHHAQIRVLSAGAVIEDLGSTNGTYINGQRLTQPHRLDPGDTIRLADYVTFRYTVEKTEGTARLSPDASPADTQAIGGPPGYGAIQRPPPPPNVIEPYEPQAREQAPPKAVAPAAPNVSYQPSPEVEHIEEAPAPRRPTALYALIGILAVLLCLCVATAVFLWFAPESFWESVFDLFNIPMPSGVITLSRWVLR